LTPDIDSKSLLTAETLIKRLRRAVQSCSTKNGVNSSRSTHRPLGRHAMNTRRRLRWAAWLVVMSSLGASDHAQSQVPAGELTIVGPSTVVVDPSTNNGSTWLRIHNGSGSRLSLSLSASDFVNKSTGHCLNVTVNFSRTADDPGSPILDGENLEADSTVAVRVHASGLWEAGESEATLYNGAVEIGKLTAVKFRVPFAVKLIDSEGGVPELLFERGTPGQFVVQNDDPMTYPVDWELALLGEGEVVAGESIVLAPSSSARLATNVPRSWYSWFSSSVKDEIQDGVLTLRFNPPGATGDPSLPSRAIPIKARLRFVSETWQYLLSGSLILIVLAAGGLFSLLLSFGLPNKLRRIELSERLNKLTVALRTLSPRIESSLRVKLRVERTQLLESLRKRFFFSSELPSLIRSVSERVDMLEKRASLLQDIDSVRGRIETIRGGAADVPSTILDEASRNLEAAAELLGDTDLQDVQFQEAQTYLEKARTSLDLATEENDELALKLAKRIASLRKDLDPSGNIGQRPKCQELRDELKDLFEVIDTDTYESGENITPGLYYWIDSSIERLFVLRHYVLRFEDTKGEPEWHKKVAESEDTLIKLLKQKRALALESARVLKRQVDTGVFASDVKTSLEQREVSIESQPPKPRAYEPARLSAVLLPGYNHSAAQDEFQCVWDFGELGTEQGWEITHFFAKPGKAQLKVSFEDAAGKPITDPQVDSPTTINREITIQKETVKWVGDRWWIGVVRFSVALLAVLLGLMAGAREQLLKLDTGAALVAIFLIGFGADAIKNLLTQTQGE
jgi:hypothetical protein